MQRLSGRLREVVVYKNQSSGGLFPSKGPGTSTLWKIIYCMQCLSNNMCSCMVSLKISLFILSSIVHTETVEIRECVKWSLTRGWNNGKSLTIGPKKWSQSLTGGGHLLEVLTVRLWLGKFGCFWLGVAYGRWSLTRGGRTWRFDCMLKLTSSSPSALQIDTPFKFVPPLALGLK